MTGASLQYYTDRADFALSQIVRGIAAQHKQFSTDMLGNESEDQNSRICVQLRAWQKPEGGWQIDRYTMMGAVMGHAVKKEQESKSDLCFFDALEYCASFQMTQIEIGKTAFPGEDADVVSFKAAAKAAGQVMDIDGRLHPCAFGQILGEGFFSKDDVAVAQQTSAQIPATGTAIMAPAFSGAVLLSPVLTAKVPAIRDDQGIVDQARSKSELTRIFQHAIHTGTVMVDSISGAIMYDFKYGLSFGETLGLGLASIATVGYYPAKRLLKGDYSVIPVQGFQMAKRQFSQAVDGLPHEDQKHVLREFIRTAEVAFQMERALNLLERDKNKSSATIKKVLVLVDSACRMAGYKDADIQRSKQAVIGGAVEPGDIFWKLANQWSPFLGQVQVKFPVKAKFDWGEFYQEAHDAVHNSDTNSEAIEAYADAIRPLKKKIQDSLTDSKFFVPDFGQFCRETGEELHKIKDDETSLVAMLQAQIPR